MKTLLNYLKELELTDLEATLYIMLLQTGPISVRALTEKIGMKRTTAYQHIESLITKGLIMKLVKGSQSLIAPTDPKEGLETLIEKKLESAKIIQEQFPSMTDLITSAFHQNKDIDQAEIRFYKGKYGISKIYQEAFKGSEFRLYVNLAELERLLFPNDFGMDYSMFERAIAKNAELKISEIIVNDPKALGKFNLNETAQTGKYQYKYMTKKIRLESPGILMYDNNVAIISSKGELNSIIVHNKDYYTYSKDLFDFIWESLI